MSIIGPAPILTADETRNAESDAQAFGTALSDLMERAGGAVAEAAWRYGGGRPVLVLCGPGNNGGDGYVAARVLAARGLDVRVAASGNPMSDLAKAARKAWTGSVETLADAKAAPVLIDALFGTGLSRPLDGAISAALARLAEEAGFVLAVDLPSGVATDTGAHLGAFPVTMTLALGALKPAHVLQPSAAICGALRCADLGLSVHSTVTLLSRPHLIVPSGIDHKYSRGLVAVIAGDMPGAALLAATAAQRAGAGYVVLSGHEPGMGGTMALVRRNLDEVLSDERTGVIVIGPGLGRSVAARKMFDRLIDGEQALVVDADALHLIEEDDFRRFARRNAPVVLTPHAGEFDALFGHGQGSKIDRARKATTDSGCKIVFKGADTVIASNDGRIAIAPHGSHWLASAGTGDVLAGIIGAMLGQGMGAHDAACAAVWLHQDTARRAGPALIADDLCDHLPAALAACL